MRILLICFFIHGVFGQSKFGSSYLKNSKLCQPWTCINSILGFDDALPPQSSYTAALQSRVPSAWHESVDSAVTVCFSADRPRVYTGTCPGQELLHCVVDNLISHCPEQSLRKNDACAPLSSLAGFKYMFSQSRYEELERWLPLEKRPVWFLKNYFSAKCCDVPPLFDSTVLKSCGFNKVIHYYSHEPKTNEPEFIPYTPESPKEVPENKEPTVTDPLDCCDMSEFIKPEMRHKCSFKTTWSKEKRLRIEDIGQVVATTTETPKIKYHDVKVVPLSCEKESCVFQQLEVLASNGSFNSEAFVKLLDNFTNNYPEWSKAKARVFTKCLSKPLDGYEYDCLINKVLACTFDVLSENCPHNKEQADPCKHAHSIKNDTICQISASKLSKNRRRFCDFPPLVPHTALASCAAPSVHRVEIVPYLQHKKVHFSGPSFCKDTTPSTHCLLTELGVLNRYQFLDYFKLKHLITQFTMVPQWSAFNAWYVGSLMGAPMYSEHCASQRKLLNVVDSVLVTCPMQRRVNSEQCNKLFSEITAEPLKPESIFHPTNLGSPYKNQITSDIKDSEIGHGKGEQKREIYPKKHGLIFDHPLFRERNVPPTKIIPIKPTTTYVPLVLTPVYMRSTTNTPMPKSFYNPMLRSDSKYRDEKDPKIIPIKPTTTYVPLVLTPVYMRSTTNTPMPKSFYNPMLRSDSKYRDEKDPFFLHNKIASAHNNHNDQHVKDLVLP